jgi:predicted HD phosphohydrolase
MSRDDIADWRAAGRHEELGCRWLAQGFSVAASEPVRLHVPAKCYWCATDVRDVAKSGTASVHTLELQGGPLALSAIALFEAEQYSRQAVCVRRSDDLGKIAELIMLSLARYSARIAGWATQSD